MLAYAADNRMGKKAKKRKQKKVLDCLLDPRSLEPNEFEGQLMKYIEDPDYEMLFMNSAVPVYVFSNKNTHELATIGARGACLATRQAVVRALADEERRQKDLEGLN